MELDMTGNPQTNAVRRQRVCLLGIAGLAAVVLTACGKPDSREPRKIDERELKSIQKQAEARVGEFLAAAAADQQDLIKQFLADARAYNAGKPWQIPDPFVAPWRQDDPARIGPPEHGEPVMSALSQEELDFHRESTRWASPQASVGIQVTLDCYGTLMDKAQLLFFLAPEGKDSRIVGFINETRERNSATATAIVFLKLAAQGRHREAQAMIAEALRYSQGQPWQSPAPFIPDLIDQYSKDLGGPLSTESLAFRFLSAEDLAYMVRKAQWAPPGTVLGATLSPLVFGQAESDLVLHFYFAPERDGYRIAGFVCAKD